MTRLIKFVLLALGAIVLLLVAAALVLPMLYDTEDLKRQVSEQVQAQTGRTLDIDGDLGFRVFPWLAVEIGQVSLGNAPGFGDEPMARIEEARAGVALMPLLRDEILIDDIVLSGLSLNLVTNARGETNWGDLVQESSAPANEGSTGPMPQSIAGLDISDAAIEWRDDQAHTHYRLSRFNLQAGAIGGGKPVPLELSGTLEDLAAGTTLGLSLQSNATLDTARSLYAMDNLTVELEDSTLNAPLVLTAPTALVDLSGGAGTLELSEFNLALGDLRIDGSLAAADLLGSPALGGTLRSNTFSARALMSSLGMEAPVTQDPDALKRVSFTSALEGSLDNLSLKGLEMTLDDSLVRGGASFGAGEITRIRFDLDIDTLDLDRYLAPATEAEAEDAGAVALPSDELAGLDVDGTLRVAALRLMGVNMTGAELGLRVREKRLRIHPLTAALYGGRYQGDITIDASGPEPVVTLDERIESVLFGELARDALGVDNVSGMAVGHFKASGAGIDSDTLLSSLQGDLGLDLGEGALEGIDVWYEIRSALSKVTGKPNPVENAGRTAFSRLNLAATIQNGLLSTDTLEGVLPFLGVDGNGTIDLSQQALDLGLVATVRNVPELEQDPMANDLRGRSVPLRLSGSLTDPTISVDAAELLKSEATHRLLDKVLGGDDEADEEASDSDRNKDAARSLIKGLLGGDRKDDDDDGDD